MLVNSDSESLRDTLLVSIEDTRKTDEVDWHSKLGICFDVEGLFPCQS